MSHTFEYNVYVDGELVDVGQLTVDEKDRMKAYHDAYSIISEGAQPDEEVEVIMPEWYSAEQKVGYRSETDAYIYAYNEGHSDARADRLNYKPTLTDRERTDFKKIFKQ